MGNISLFSICCNVGGLLFRFFGIMSNTKQSKKAPKSLLKDEEIVFTQEDLDEELSKLKEKIDPN